MVYLKSSLYELKNLTSSGFDFAFRNCLIFTLTDLRAYM